MCPFLFLILYQALLNHKPLLLPYALLDVQLALHDHQFGPTITYALNYSLLHLSSMISPTMLTIKYDGMSSSYNAFLSSFSVIKNHPPTMRQSLIPVGYLLRTMNSKLWRVIIHGRLLIYHREKLLSAINGFPILNTILTAVWIGLKPVLLRKLTPNFMVWIFSGG